MHTPFHPAIIGATLASPKVSKSIIDVFDQQLPLNYKNDIYRDKVYTVQVDTVQYFFAELTTFPYWFVFIINEYGVVEKIMEFDLTQDMMITINYHIPVPSDPIYVPVYDFIMFCRNVIRVNKIKKVLN